MNDVRLGAKPKLLGDENMKNENIEHEEMTEEERELMEFKVKETMNVIADMETTSAPTIPKPTCVYSKP